MWENDLIHVFPFILYRLLLYKNAPSSTLPLGGGRLFLLSLMLPTHESKTTGHKFNERKGVGDEVLELPIGIMQDNTQVSWLATRGLSPLPQGPWEQTQQHALNRGPNAQGLWEQTYQHPLVPRLCWGPNPQGLWEQTKQHLLMEFVNNFVSMVTRLRNVLAPFGCVGECINTCFFLYSLQITIIQKCPFPNPTLGGGGGGGWRLSLSSLVLKPETTKRKVLPVSFHFVFCLQLAFICCLGQYSICLCHFVSLRFVSFRFFSVLSPFLVSGLVHAVSNNKFSCRFFFFCLPLILEYVPGLPDGNEFKQPPPSRRPKVFTRGGKSCRCNGNIHVYQLMYNLQKPRLMNVGLE